MNTSHTSENLKLYNFVSKLKSQCNHLDFIVLDENWALTVNIFTNLCKNFYR